MDWKKFFKPAAKKIIIYIFLFIFLISGFEFSECIIHSVSTPLPQLCRNPLFDNGIVIIIMFLLTLLWGVIAAPAILISILLQLNMTSEESIAMNNILSVILLISLIIECYLISCIIEWIYIMRKKKK